MSRTFQSKILKYTVFTLLTMFLVGIAVITYFNYNPKDYYELREYLNKNSIDISTSNNLDINNVNVFWSSEFKSGQIIKNGKNTNLIFKEYGPNRFYVLYQKDTIKEFTYFKSNNWHGHKHIITLSKDKHIEVGVKIVGPDIK